MHSFSEGTGPAIMVADDNPGIRRFVAECLKSRGFAVSEAQDGIAACELAEADPPALVLLDLLLPRRERTHSGHDDIVGRLLRTQLSDISESQLRSPSTMMTSTTIAQVIQT